MKKTVIVVPHNHFDPSWRRCFDKPSVLGDTCVASYAEVEKQVIGRWIEYGQSFTEGQAAVLRKYLEKCPQHKEQLTEWARAGKFACTMSGETVPDTNLPAPEGLIRNYLVSMPLYREIVGENHEALVLAWYEDSFGGSPNYPQIIRDLGADVLCRICYTQPKNRIWTGIDGSRVAWLERFYNEMALGTFEKHPWCDECRGKGCAACEESGLRFVPPMGYGAVFNMLEQAVLSDSEFMVMIIGGEEILPEPELLTAISDMRRKYPDADIKLGTTLDIYKHVKFDIYKAYKNDPITEPEDLNPVFSGCFSSRIDIKQRVRNLTYRLCSAEAKLACEAFDIHEHIKSPDSFVQAWEKITFCQFHDIITGTLTDSAYAEAMEMLDCADKIIEQYLPVSKAEKNVKYSIQQERVLHWGENTITVDDCGIVSMETAGKRIFTERPYGRLMRPFRIGELVLEPDAGDAWATRIGPSFNPRDNQTMLQLGEYQKIVHISGDRVVWSGCYKDPQSSTKPQGTDYMVKKLVWTTFMKRGQDGLVEFITEIDWDTSSRRVKALFPVSSNEDKAFYEVPFGCFERRYDESKVDYASWSPNYMEYPAENWVLARTDESSGAAIINKGIPGFRWLPGCFEMSMLRSPQFHFVGNEQRNYDFNDFEGLRDSGRHKFEYALLPFVDGKTVYSLSKIALDFNLDEEIKLPFDLSGEVIVTAFKPAEDGDGFILRFYNPADKGVFVKIWFGTTADVIKCNILEKQIEPCAVGESYQRTLRGFEIVTLKIKIASYLDRADTRPKREEWL